MSATIRRLFAWASVVPFLFLAGCMSIGGRKIPYLIQPEYSARDPQFARSMGQLLGPAVIGGNKTTVLLNGDQIFPAMLKAINEAQRSIDFETYIYWQGKIGAQFADALAARSLSGVQVHVLVDWLGSSKIDPAYVRKMEAAGVEVERYHPLHWFDLSRFNQRTHRKLLIVDGKIGFTGGAGIADLWSGNAQDADHWRDTQFRLEGPAVAQMQAAFMDNWMKTHPQVLHDSDYFPELAPVGQDFAQVVQSSPREGIESMRLMYLMAIAAAKNKIQLSASYFVPGPRAIRALIEAKERGVDIEIITPGANDDVQIVRHASHSTWGPLLKAGIRIYEYQPTMYHCKVMVVDDVWVSVGSANFDTRSFRLNDEANLNIYSAEFAAEQSELFEEDKKHAEQITFSMWEHRSVFNRFQEFFANLFKSQL